MDISDIRLYCSQKPGSWEDFPFDETTLVIKTGSKMYALISLTNTPVKINLKCDPDRSQLLRRDYPSITEGYHMNKRHWNTVTTSDKSSHDVSDNLLKELIDHSYNLVFSSLTKKEKLTITDIQ
ncbi:MAG: MmcQ/YjbR family DNA-binding protein [Spirochaetes bacterium]|nr:MmcQ/YjbR family DNA-binding protein [Spirochaetota bacterium]MBN2769520.1 MmcQ/YjbR family DNA-binding protein [Spirochaetota bacterium]